MASTAAFESAQALFCAIADNVGKMNIDNVLNFNDDTQGPCGTQ